jgi:hypothetical protein
MLLGVFRSVLQDLIFCLPSHDMLASRRRVNFGTFDHFAHDDNLLTIKVVVEIVAPNQFRLWLPSSGSQAVAVPPGYAGLDLS